MESHVKIFGHPLHPMLIVLPLGLLSMAVIFDIVQFITHNTMFSIVAYWNILAGVITGLLAAIFGLMDWLSIPSGTRAKAVGALHGGGNVVVVLLFAISWFLRRNNVDYVPEMTAFLLALIGLVIAGFTGWLGGELVYRLRMGVDDGANLNAPNSLSGAPAGDTPVAAGPARR